MKALPVLFWFAFFLCCLPGACLAIGEALQDGAPVDLDADQLTYDKPSGLWRAEGDVRLKKGGLTLLTDSLEYRPATGEAAAVGRVLLGAPEGTAEGERLLLNTETGAGRFLDGRLLVREGNYRLAGDLLERMSEQDYRIEEGTFTTCDAVPPAWKFSARHLDLSIGGYARARHVFFYIHDVPILYTPFFFYPVKTERESGLLPPRIGSSNRRGFQLSLAWYQVIGRNLDATFYLDYLSKMGIGKGLEYRYILGQENEGEAHVYHINGLAGEENRWAIDWQHAGPLPGDLRLIADVEYVSSRDYFEDFGVVAEEYNKDFAQSVLALTRLWPHYSLTGQVKYLKDLESENDFTLQKLPEVVFSALPQRLSDTPFYLGMEGSYSYLWREEGMTGQRLDLRPELSAVFHPGDLLDLRAAVGYRERLYSTSDEGPGFEHEGLVDLSAHVASRFSRVFRLDGTTLQAIRHSVEPELIWSYIPEVNQEHLPQFSPGDTIDPANLFTYSLTNRFTARLEMPGGKTRTREIAYLRLSQGYDLREARRDTDPGEDRKPFTLLRLELRTMPTSSSWLNLDLRYDTNPDTDHRLAQANLAGGIKDKKGNSLSLEYLTTRDDTRYLAATTEIAWLRPVYLTYQHRQDLEEGETQEKVFGLEYRAQCWSLFLSVRDRPDDTEYLISFTLAGLGRVADFGGSLRDTAE